MLLCNDYSLAKKSTTEHAGLGDRVGGQLKAVLFSSMLGRLASVQYSLHMLSTAVCRELAKSAKSENRY